MAEQLDILKPHTYSGKTPTSRKAAANALGKSGTNRYRVMLTIANTGPVGATDDELQAILKMSVNTQRPRRVELVKAGYVKASGYERYVRETDNTAIVWVATPEGLAALREAQ